MRVKKEKEEKPCIACGLITATLIKGQCKKCYHQSYTKEYRTSGRYCRMRQRYLEANPQIIEENRVYQRKYQGRRRKYLSKLHNLFRYYSDEELEKMIKIYKRYTEGQLIEVSNQ